MPLGLHTPLRRSPHSAAGSIYGRSMHYRGMYLYTPTYRHLTDDTSATAAGACALLLRCASSPAAHSAAASCRRLSHFALVALWWSVAALCRLTPQPPWRFHYAPEMSARIMLHVSTLSLLASQLGSWAYR